jgi:hypothetical protein
MRDGIRFLATIGLGLIMVIGCGGSGGSPAAAGSQGAPATSATSASQAPAATSVASVAGVPSASPAGGGAGGGVCALVSTDELAGIFGVPVTTTVVPGPPDTCTVAAAGAPLAAFVLTPTGGGAVFDAYAGDPAATTISGMGDKAAYSPAAQLLVILKGDALFSMSAYDQSKTPEQRLELMKKVGAIAAGRM